ncbi:hypothetical protein IT882_04270 [Microbacterium schleiferi]|uniref:Uncharacterized protein n=2 Tax=Microbacterium schleiferi TaxID=69362 RepID=A0A7S8MXZ9_9MICO|nr:hypothetical protein IT882_04270 [Microbacterium schleiferi]
MITADMIERAADAMFFEDCGEAVSDEYRATEDFDAKFREYARVALIAALEPDSSHVSRVYESCVTDSGGRCTRWSHYHSEDPAADITRMEQGT